MMRLTAFETAAVAALSLRAMFPAQHIASHTIIMHLGYKVHLKTE